MESDEELIDIVDKNNKVVGKSSRGDAHKKGLIHRSLSVLILNSKGQILLQQRSSNRVVHALSWDLSTSEHVLSGETYKRAGIRSVKEELGVKVTVKIVTETILQKRVHNVQNQIVYENEIVCMLIATHDGPFKIDPVEVNKVEFFTVEEIEEMIKQGKKFTPWFLEEWENVKLVVRHI